MKTLEKLTKRHASNRALTHTKSMSRNLRHAVLFAGSTALSIGLSPRQAHAYSIHSAVSDGCHEQITMDALRLLREHHGTEASFSPNRDERALINDAPYSVDSDMDDLGAVALVLSNRHVDLGDSEPDELDQVALLHSNPANQSEHCLRRPGDNGTEGVQDALDACRDTILSRVENAIETLDSSGEIDTDARKDLDVFLEFRGAVEASLPAFYVEMGQALHTLQDAFSHHLRGDTHETVSTVLNYADFAEGSLDEERDGPPHSSYMDECVDLDDLRSDRISMAKNATYELLEAVLHTEGDSADKMRAAEEIVDGYLTLEEGCTYENDWCEAEDGRFPDRVKSGGCTISLPGTSDRHHWLWPGLLAGLVFAYRSRRAAVSVARSERGSKRAKLFLLSGCLISTGTVAPVARAETSSPPAIDTEESHGPPFGVFLGGAGAVQDPAAAAILGGRYRVGENFQVGLNAEWNPLFSKNSGQSRPGMANAYASAIFRMPTANEGLSLRSTIHLGTSTLLFDLYGANRGSTGPFVALNFLGLDYEFFRNTYFIVDPATITVAAPQLRGVPFVYTQYRVTLGLQWGS